MNLLIFQAGDFGSAVADRLAQVFGQADRVDLARDAKATAVVLERLSDYDFIAVASGRPYDAVMRQIDHYNAALGKPWTSVVLNGTNLVVAPRFESGSSCYHCLVSRMEAHNREGDRSIALRAAYDRDPAVGPPGHTGPIRELAVAGIREAVAKARPNRRFRQIDVVMGTVQESDLIPLHDCPRCRPAPEDYDQTHRFTDHLIPTLRELRQ